jgi:transposase
MVQASAVERPTRDELLAIYRAGPAAMLVLVEALLDRIATREAANVALTARVKALEDRLALDSHNSSKPPASDVGRPAPAPRSLRPRPGETGRAPGGQPGHPGTTLRLVDRPDRLVVHRPAQCGTCGHSLDAAQERLDPERRQVVELPALALAVTEHRVAQRPCPACGVATAGIFPVGVTHPVQYGERLKAVAVYLHAYQLLPYGRATALLDDLFGAGGQVPCARTLAAAETTADATLAPVEVAIKEALRQATVAGFDETSVRVNGHREWLHVATTTHLTHYAVHPKRGTGATDAIDILPTFTGTATHDAWAPYLTYTDCTHALCNAHLLRELVFLHEQDHQAWADELATLLVTAKDLVDAACAAGVTHLDELTRATLDAHYDHLLAQGRATNPPLEPPPDAPPKRGRPKQSKAQNLLDRLTTHRQAVWAFAQDFRVPFDNNQAERDLRMLKVQQKISGGFRSPEGARRFARLRGYISTLRKQGLPVLAALQSVFAGSPLMPTLAS